MTIDEAKKVECGDLLVVQKVPDNSALDRCGYQVGDIVVANDAPDRYDHISPDHYGEPTIMVSIQGVPGKAAGTMRLGPFATYLKHFEATWWDIWIE